MICSRLTSMVWHLNLGCNIGIMKVNQLPCKSSVHHKPKEKQNKVQMYIHTSIHLGTSKCMAVWQIESALGIVMLLGPYICDCGTQCWLWVSNFVYKSFVEDRGQCEPLHKIHGCIFCYLTGNANHVQRCKISCQTIVQVSGV